MKVFDKVLKKREKKESLGYLKMPKIFFLIFLLCLFFFIFLTKPPKNFENYSEIQIKEGSTIRQASELLKEKNIIRSRNLFNILVQLSENKTVSSGRYIFENPASVFRVAERLINSEYGLPTQNVTLSEGMTVAEMAEKLDQTYENFDTELFLELATSFEGYLFPSTYKFNVDVTAEEVLQTLVKTFISQIATIDQEIINSRFDLDEIIIMASIIEKEATKETIQDVSDLLWGRIEADMPLQVDAPFVYSIGKGTFDLTQEDLLEDGPYNTYLNLGLPPTPISNPGLESILAAANPRPTENVYFLTGLDGEMYFAKSFEEHKKNKALYLK